MTGAWDSLIALSQSMGQPISANQEKPWRQGQTNTDFRYADQYFAGIGQNFMRFRDEQVSQLNLEREMLREVGYPILAEAQQVLEARQLTAKMQSRMQQLDASVAGIALINHVRHLADLARNLSPFA